MRSALATGVSVLLMAMGFVSVIWVSSGLIGAARSQSPMDVQAPLPAPPSMNLPPTENAAPVTDDLDSNAAPILGEEYAPSSVTTEGYVYDPSGRRDPFKPMLPEVVQPTTGQVVISSDPLLAYDISQYKIVGILWDTQHPKAMIKDPTGKTFAIKKETKLGRNNGFVSMIREGAVLVVEPAFGDNGLQTAVTRVLLLSK